MGQRETTGDPGARRIAGRLLGGLIVTGAAVAVIITLLQWETRPQTDDATVRANFVGIAPQVSAGRGADTAGEPRRVRALALVVCDARTDREPRGAAPPCSGRPVDPAAA